MQFLEGDGWRMRFCTFSERPVIRDSALTVRRTAVTHRPVTYLRRELGPEWRWDATRETGHEATTATAMTKDFDRWMSALFRPGRERRS